MKNMQNLFTRLPTDIHRIIFSFLDDDNDLYKVESSILHNDHDVFWKERLCCLTPLGVPSNRELYDIFWLLKKTDYDEVSYQLGLYDTLLAKKEWNNVLIKEMLNDEIFLKYSINCKDYYERPIIMVCPMNSFPKLISYNVDVNSTDSSGKTALFRVTNNKTSKLLLQAGADINHQDNEKNTVLSLAVENKNLKYVKFLLKNGANPNVELEYGETILMTYIDKMDEVMLQTLLKHGADPNCTDTTYSPLMLTINKNYNNFVQLLEAGADVNHNHWDGTTVLELCAKINNSSYLEKILEFKPKLDIRGYHYETALMIASRTGLIDNVRLLLNAGASPAIRDEDGKTASDIAANNEIYYLIQDKCGVKRNFLSFLFG